jgi:hypothetical protein
MKTPVRKTVNKSQAGPYNLMHIEILSPRYGGDRYLESIGMITFQQTIGEDKWYGMNFEVRTDNINKLKKFTKLAGFVAKNTSYDSQPDELLNLIGADEHVFYESDFFSKSKDGQSLYRVIAQGGHYTDIIAPDDKTAQKQLDKLNIAGSTLEFRQKVVLS